MFELKEYPNSVPQNKTTLPGPGWVRQWHGYYLPPAHDYLSYGLLERYAFLSILETYAGRHVTLFELGAGRADWCMALAGAIAFRLVPSPPASYRALAIEAEPTHFEWVKQVIEAQALNVVPVFGAVTRHSGGVNFLTSTDPLSHFGQSIIPDGDRRGTRVVSYTVDQLRVEHGFEKISIVHMDVQGAEADCVLGSKQSVEAGLIEHFLIETHNSRVEEEIASVLAATHVCVVDLPRDGRLEIPGFSKLISGKGGGIQLWRMKGLGDG